MEVVMKLLPLSAALAFCVATPAFASSQETVFPFEPATVTLHGTLLSVPCQTPDTVRSGKCPSLRLHLPHPATVRNGNGPDRYAVHQQDFDLLIDNPPTIRPGPDGHVWSSPSELADHQVIAVGQLMRPADHSEPVRLHVRALEPN